MALPCCPAGYTFVDSGGYYVDPSTSVPTQIRNYSPTTTPYNKCFVLQSGYTAFTPPPVDPIACGCCPTGYAVVNSEGYLALPSRAVIFVGNSLAGKCVSLADFSTNVEADDCPCCPPGYVYHSLSGRCLVEDPFGSILKQQTVDTIPCITCVCSDVIPPPECVSCTTSQGMPISFSFNNTIKQCQDCTPVGEQTGFGTGADAFIPIQLIDPIINFTLR